MSRVIAGAAAMMLLPSSAAVAQLEPAATPLPDLFPDVQTALVRNELSGPTVNEVVDSTARFAHKEIGGRISSGKRNGFFSSLEPASLETVRAGLDCAQLENNLIVISGGDSQSTVGFARNFPNTAFVDIGQPQPCVDSDGRFDPSGTCEGETFMIPANYMAVNFQVEDAAYLAGVIAAAATRDDRLGIISGKRDCEECNRYIQGFVQGARSLKPDVEIELAYIADDDEAHAFGDPTTAKTFTKAFIDVYQPDVLLPIARGASKGMIEAACEAGILAVGTDIDMSNVHLDLADCVLTSIIKDTEFAVRESIFRFSNGELLPTWDLGLQDGHVDVTDEWTRVPTLRGDAVERYASAREAIITDRIASCPDACGAPVSLGPDDDPVADDTPTDGG